VRTDSNARFLRRPRIILKLTIFAVIGTSDFALWFRAEEPAGASATLPLPCAGAAIPGRVANAGHPDVPIYAIGLGTVQASFTVGINSQLDGIVQDALTDGELLVNAQVGILPSSASTEVTQ
jgi:multidrug efflux pump subunit AcrA (membrane-fusion protein)